MPGSRWVTFDCFGTIMDWNAGVAAALATVVPDVPAERLIAEFHEAERQVKHTGHYRRYRTILGEATEQVAHAHGRQLSAVKRDVIARQWPRFEPFRDTPHGLHALQESGWRLGILTNCDRDLFAATTARLPAAFDLTITAEEIKSYKPDLRHFEEFQRRARAGVWVHVANSWLHDIEPAARLGIPRIWIDRDRSGNDPSVASAVLHDFERLPDSVEQHAQNAL